MHILQLYTMEFSIIYFRHEFLRNTKRAEKITSITNIIHAFGTSVTDSIPKRRYDMECTRRALFHHTGPPNCPVLDFVGSYVAYFHENEIPIKMHTTPSIIWPDLSRKTAATGRRERTTIQPNVNSINLVSFLIYFFNTNEIIYIPVDTSISSGIDSGCRMDDPSDASPE